MNHQPLHQRAASQEAALAFFGSLLSPEIPLDATVVG